MSPKIVSQSIMLKRPVMRRTRIPVRRGGGPGEPYLGPVLLRVRSRDEKGRVSDVTVCRDDTVVNLDQGDEFVTAFVAACAAEGPDAKA